MKSPFKTDLKSGRVLFMESQWLVRVNLYNSFWFLLAAHKAKIMIFIHSTRKLNIMEDAGPVRIFGRSVDSRFYEIMK